MCYGTAEHNTKHVQHKQYCVALLKGAYQCVHVKWYDEIAVSLSMLAVSSQATAIWHAALCTAWIINQEWRDPATASLRLIYSLSCFRVDKNERSLIYAFHLLFPSFISALTTPFSSSALVFLHLMLFLCTFAKAMRHQSQ